MTVQELISRYDEERPNQIDQNIKIRWLRQIEKMLWKDIVLTHSVHGMEDLLRRPMQKPDKKPDKKPEFYEGFDLDKYFEDWDVSGELVADEPYQEIYFDYMDMQRARMQNENTKYNMASQLFNNSLSAFRDYWNRTHYPKQHPTLWYNHRRLD